MAFGGNVEPGWGAYITPQYSLRSRSEAWLCIIAEVDPVARSGSICADPVHMTRGPGTAQTRVIVTNTTANGPVLTKRLHLIVAEKEVCPTVPGNYRSHDVSCFPNPFLERTEDAVFAWTHPGAENTVGLVSQTTGADGAVVAGREVKLAVNYLLQDATRATICVRPVFEAPVSGKPPSSKAGPDSRCSHTEVQKGFGTAAVSFTVSNHSSMPAETAGLWIERACLAAITGGSQVGVL